MTFRVQDVKPNASMPLASVRVGSTSDARWRSVRDSTTRVDAAEAHRAAIADPTYSTA